MTMPVGLEVTGKVLNLAQLDSELNAAGVTVHGLGTQGPEAERNGPTYLFTYDTVGEPADLPLGAQPVVDAHVAMRDKTDAEYSAEFQDPNTTVARKQEIRDITAGLLPREQVPM